MRVIDCAQYSREWFDARLGIPTASNFKRILTPGGKLSKQADAYICELLAEKMGAPTIAGPVTPAMMNGTANEDGARKMYEHMFDRDITQVGFVTTDDGRMGGSPDGIIDMEYGLEIKCPEGKTHVEWSLDGVLPDEHAPQVHGYMIVTGLRRWHFMSYVPIKKRDGTYSFEHCLKPLVLTVDWNEYTDKLALALESFWTRYQELADRLAKV